MVAVQKSDSLIIGDCAKVQQPQAWVGRSHLQDSRACARQSTKTLSAASANKQGVCPLR